MKILALAGSLRAVSINAAFCRAAVRLAPTGMNVTVYASLGSLPLFNPDLESAPPDAVQALRSAVGRADALLIASPEYAHGVSGVMKNALDWLVSYEGFVQKPVAVINTSPRAHHAYESLVETLRTMSAAIVDDASVAIPLLGVEGTEEGILRSAELAGQVRAVLASIRVFLEVRAVDGGGVGWARV